MTNDSLVPFRLTPRAANRVKHAARYATSKGQSHPLWPSRVCYRSNIISGFFFLTRHVAYNTDFDIFLIFSDRASPQTTGTFIDHWCSTSKSILNLSAYYIVNSGNTHWILIVDTSKSAYNFFYEFKIVGRRLKTIMHGTGVIILKLWKIFIKKQNISRDNSPCAVLNKTRLQRRTWKNIEAKEVLLSDLKDSLYKIKIKFSIFFFFIRRKQIKNFSSVII